MGLHKGMRYKKGESICEIKSVEGNDIFVQCITKKYVKESSLRNIKFIKNN